MYLAIPRGLCCEIDQPPPAALPDYLFNLIDKTELCLLCKHLIDIMVM